MQKIIYKFLQFILGFQTRLYKKKLGAQVKTFRNSSNVVSFNDAADMNLNCGTEKTKQELERKVKKIVRENLENPEALLEFVSTHNTVVQRVKYADKVLSFIGEEEGFITPLKGVKAFYLNLVIGLAQDKKIKISFNTAEMFVLRPMTVDIYSMIHQFHKWYSYKMELPGFEQKTQKNFKKVFKTLSYDDINELSLGEIVSLKEAVARDVEAIDFVVNLAKEFEASTKLLKKIKNGESVSV